MGIAVLAPFGRLGLPGGIAVALAQEGPVFLTPEELETLRGAVDRFIPGPPEDPDPGAVVAGCAEAIDAMLGAFLVDPPLIFAGAPFSDRGGSPVNHFEEFLRLDRYEEVSWRLRIEGSAGRRELEFNGPVTGWQTTYRQGLAALDQAAPGGDFSALPGPGREAVLRTADDPRISAFVDVAFPHTLQFMYGAPEYGGNRGLVGWEYTRFMGDVQPRGFTDEEVEDPGTARPAPSVPTSVAEEDLAALAALGSPEAALGVIARSDGTLSGLRREVARLIGHHLEDDPGAG